MRQSVNLFALGKPKIKLLQVKIPGPLVASQDSGSTCCKSRFRVHLLQVKIPGPLASFTCHILQISEHGSEGVIRSCTA